MWQFVILTKMPVISMKKQYEIRSFSHKQQNYGRRSAPMPSSRLIPFGVL
jgi:hypothetical protein